MCFVRGLVQACADVHKDQKRASVLPSELLELNLQGAIGCLLWVLGAELGFSGRAASALTTEPPLQSTFFFETSLLISLKSTDQSRLSGHQALGICLSPSPLLWDYKPMLPHQTSLMWFQGSNSGPHTNSECTVLAEPSPQA